MIATKIDVQLKIGAIPFHEELCWGSIMQPHSPNTARSSWVRLKDHWDIFASLAICGLLILSHSSHMEFLSAVWVPSQLDVFSLVPPLP